MIRPGSNKNQWIQIAYIWILDCLESWSVDPALEYNRHSGDSHPPSVVVKSGSESQYLASVLQRRKPNTWGGLISWSANTWNFLVVDPFVTCKKCLIFVALFFCKILGNICKPFWLPSKHCYHACVIVYCISQSHYQCLIAYLLYWTPFPV